MFEKRRDFGRAMEGYMNCLAECGISGEGNIESRDASSDEKKKKHEFMRELRGEVMLRIAVLRKEMGALDQSMQMCNNVAADNFSDAIRVNALCLKVQLLYRNHFFRLTLIFGVVRVCCTKCEQNFHHLKLFIDLLCK